jgi:hypothetical protein
MHMRKGDNGARGASWNDQVARLMSSEGMPRDKARDRVIVDCLKRGDSSALAALLIDGHVPAPSVRFALALMLLDNAEADAAIARHHIDPELWWLPHRFVIKARPAKPRRPQGTDKDAGERRPEKHSGPMMPDLGYEAAIACLDEAVRATDAAGAKPPVRQKRPAPKPKR